MAKKNVYNTWSDLERAVKSGDFKHVKLQDSDGGDLVSFNSNVNKISFADNLKKIQKKITAMDDGLFIVLCQHRFGKGVTPQKFLFGKGSYTLSEEKPHQEEKHVEPALSVKSALENVEKSSKAMAENDYLKKELSELKAKFEVLEEKYKKEISELTAEIDDLNDTIETLEEGEGESSGGDGMKTMADFLKETVPSVLPALDRYFDLKEKKLNLEQTKFLAENGYEIPTLKKIQKTNGHKKVHVKKQLPQPGEEGWDELISEIEVLDDTQFWNALNEIKAVDESIYEALYNELIEEAEEEEKEES